MRITMLHISFVLYWPGANNIMRRLWTTGLSHISCVLKWSGAYSSDNGPTSTASLHISCVLYRSGTYENDCGPSWTASLHIFLVLKWSGTNPSENGLLRIASFQSTASNTDRGNMPMSILLYALLRYLLGLTMIWGLYYKERDTFMRNTFI